MVWGHFYAFSLFFSEKFSCYTVHLFLRKYRGGEDMADEVQSKVVDLGLKIVMVVVVAAVAMAVIGGNLIQFVQALL